MTARVVIAVLTSIAVFFGMGHQPYGYYQLLRLLICGFSLFLLLNSELPLRVDWQRWVTVGCAVLYNPILPVRLGDRDIWVVLNVLTVLWFWILAVRRERTKA
jgi:hypothetical protein